MPPFQPLPRKKSNTPWIILALVGGAIVVFCGFGGILIAVSPDSAVEGDKKSAQSTDTKADESEQSEPVDTDGDGVNDDVDFKPDDPQVRTEDDIDTDKDGVPDYQDYRPADPKVKTRDDVDTDKDGVPDYKDDFPKNAKYSKDSDDDGVPDSLDAFPQDARYSKDADGDHVADSKDAFPRDPTRSKITLAMENALSAAQDYLDYSAFSRQGLIDQLSSDYGSGFSVADATWAVDQLHANWKEQAVRAAKDYLDYSSFSRQGLIDQLSSSYGSQFTREEATYAVNQVGL